MPTRKDRNAPYRYRSGEAARLAGMPAATLRIWERRYGVVAPPKTPSGQRMYSDDDVQRIRLLKALVSAGHAIGSIAQLGREELEALSVRRSHGAIPADEVVRLAVIGPLAVTASAAARVGIEIAERFDSIEQAGESAQSRIDALIAMVPSLHADAVAGLARLAQARQARAVSVVYGFGTAEAVELARLSGFELFRSIESRANPLTLVAKLAHAVVASRHASEADQGLWLRRRRRFDEATLASLGSLSSTVQCECPRHLSELILQLSAFEQYSDECLSRSPADALLHRHLGDAANRAASLLEMALDVILRKEGLAAPDGTRPA
ncbi:MerR family transcriptional regulator [Burkholderia glumae]|uniref:MerR family transcriptional regulator n=1 Tax=Burkholderia glumae TaxID=337 RepID=UPI00039D92BF|nr:MerR family transcriptional regulator [Burkholderia glumae]MCM2495926.1 MerR family transcriptional regulator [Burkholderia glumae]MCM2546885.1 MerR family transcriptional regulator [Burkholderia glumae]MCQ0033416.1 MerR family transcriptional regulator [Burkholderia glumae]MCQ0039546.1 MerR family transcriptional regulator [Burkholderia glumae]QJW82111.1 MerR family transcriptional regulator [Burkholderia glumae]